MSKILNEASLENLVNKNVDETLAYLKKELSVFEALNAENSIYAFLNQLMKRLKVFINEELGKNEYFSKIKEDYIIKLKDGVKQFETYYDPTFDERNKYISGKLLEISEHVSLEWLEATN